MQIIRHFFLSFLVVYMDCIHVRKPFGCFFAKTGPIPHETKRYRFLALNALADRIGAA